MFVRSAGYVTGISFTNWDDKGANTEISYNHLHHTGCTTFPSGLDAASDECLSDGGALYGSSTTPSQTPVFVHHNVIHDITARNFGGVGIYLDTSTNAAQVHHNVVFNVADQCFYWHLETFGKVPLVPVKAGVQPTRVENNVFVKSTVNPRPMMGGTPGWHSTGKIVQWDGYTNSTFAHNIVYVNLPGFPVAAEDSTQLESDASPSQKPVPPMTPPILIGGAACAPHFHVKPNATCTVHAIDTYNNVELNHNLYWNVTDNGTRILEFNGTGALAEFGQVSWQHVWRGERGHDVDSIVADPGFVDPATGDYRLRANSPAIGIGHEAWDWKAAGAVGPVEP
jgi:hypothetical protein